MIALNDVGQVVHVSASTVLSCLPPPASVLSVLYGCVQFLKKKYYVKKRFSVTSNLRYMHGVLNVDEIKN
jgi:hypothetical protein